MKHNNDKYVVLLVYALVHAAESVSGDIILKYYTKYGCRELALYIVSFLGVYFI